VGRHQHLLAKSEILDHEVRDEVKSLIAGGGKPNIVLNPVVWSFHDEISHDGNLLDFFVRCSHYIIEQLVPILLAHNHRRNSDSTTSSIITQDYGIDVFISVIDDDAHSNANIFHISDLLDE
jgi:hypothetical protein